jgi:tRNA nucleotidyltransferase (CCA-adding enzyme)
MTPAASSPAPDALTDAAARAAMAGALPVVRRLREAGHEAVLVGGGVRDLLLGRPVEDWDVATSASPEAVAGLFPRTAPTGLRHGTISVLLENGSAVEVTTFRSEGPYADGRHPDWVTLGVSLEDDLGRRDFTVNALAYDPVDAVLVDPHGGVLDLKARILRTVGDPDRRFAEDGLRPLRGARLAAVLEFAVEPATLVAMARARESARRVAAERVRGELMKLMAAPRPSVGIEILRRTGLLEDVLPELLEGVGVSQNRYHAYDVYEHALHALDAAPADRPLVRLAALLHDVGKPRTRVEVDGEGTFYRHEQVGRRLVLAMLDRLRFSRAERDAVAHLVGEHMFHYTPDWSDAAVRRFLRRVGPENVPDLFALREADDRGHGTGASSREALTELAGRIERIQAAREALAVEDLAVDGHDVMRALRRGPGPQIGSILERLLERVIEDPSLNTRDQLLALLDLERERLDDTGGRT